MSFAKDLTGLKYGKLKVLSRNFEKQQEWKDKTGLSKAFWDCACDCGNKVVVSSSCLTNKTNPTRSCGCLREEVSHRQKNTKSITWLVDGETTTGITCAGDRFVIDTSDLGKVENYCWRVDKHGYVVANARNGTNQTVRIYHLILSILPGAIVDHKDWDKLNNKKSNLRIANKSQNNTNIKRKCNNTSGYTGVKKTKSGSYVAQISFNKKKIYLGTFKTLEEAVKVRHKAEQAIHSEWSGEINRKDFKKYLRGEKNACQ